jgi:hypothetical protein
MYGSSSRYNEGQTLWVTTKSRGNKQSVFLNTVVAITVPYTLALMREGDDMTMLADATYADARRWWVVADANPQWFYPMDSFPGQSLRVPT